MFLCKMYRVASTVASKAPGGRGKNGVSLAQEPQCRCLCSSTRVSLPWLIAPSPGRRGGAQEGSSQCAAGAEAQALGSQHCTECSGVLLLSGEKGCFCSFWPASSLAQPAAAACCSPSKKKSHPQTHQMSVSAFTSHPTLEGHHLSSTGSGSDGEDSGSTVKKPLTKLAGKRRCGV